MEFSGFRNLSWLADAAGAPVPAWLAATGLLVVVALSLALARMARAAARGRAREGTLRRLVDESPHLICVLDTEGAVRRLNRTGEHWLQVRADEVRGRPLHDLPGACIAPAQGMKLAFAIEAASRDGTAAHELVVRRRDGVELVLDCTLRALPAAEGRRGEVLIEARDVTLRRSAEDKLRLAAAVFDQAREGILIHDLAGTILSVNQAFCDISGYPAEELVGGSVHDLAFCLGDEEHRHRMQEAIALHGHWQGELRNARRDGEERVCWVSVSRRHDDAGAALDIAIFNDITEFREAERNLARMAHLDALTGLPNRDLFADRAGQLVGVSRRDGRPFALMYIDLDQFKLVNEGLGLRVGDGLLAAVGQRLQGTLRECDTVARLGGDEFAVLLPGAEADGAAQVAQKLLDAVARPVTIGQVELSVTASIGIAMFPSDGADHESLSRHADTAMYRAKHEGRAAARFFAEGMQRRSARHLQLDAALRRALERDELLIHYQPQLSADGRGLLGVEALLRWRHPELGLVSPAEFIPLAESNGQILPIGEWVLRTAVRQVRAWMEAGLPPMVVAVNLSAVQFRHPALVDMVRKALDDAGLPARWLELELTESVVTDDADGAIATMDALRALGVRLSIDDFGTGYSSLSYLKRFPIDMLKIDQSFVRDIDTDPDDRAIVQAIIQMAHAMKLKTVAEGVETDAQHHFLRREGCDMVQGYRFCRPVDGAALLEWARAHLAAEAEAPAGKARTPAAVGLA